MNKSDLQGPFIAPEKKVWDKIPTLDATKAALARKGVKEEEKRAAERTEYASSKPIANRVRQAVNVAYADKGRDMERQHGQEVASHEALTTTTLESYENLTANLFGQQANFHKALQTALATAWKGAEPAIDRVLAEQGQKEADYRQSVSTRQNIIRTIENAHNEALDALAEIHGKILAILLQHGAPCNFKKFDTEWREEIRTTLHGVVSGAHEVADIELPEPPKEPGIIPIRTTYDLKKKRFGIGDFMVMLGGIAIGSSFGSIVGGLNYDSKGYHPNFMFWLMLILGISLSYVVGRLFLPEAMQAIMLDTIDAYPYVDAEEEELQLQQTTQEEGKGTKGKKRRAAKDKRFAYLEHDLYEADINAGKWKTRVAVVYAMFAAVDFIGWYKATAQYNASVAWNAHAFHVDPVASGAGMAFVTALFVACKQADISMYLRPIKAAIMDEIGQNVGIYYDLTNAFNQACVLYNINMSAFHANNDKKLAVEGNVMGRMAQITPHIEPLMEEYLELKLEAEANYTMALRNVPDALPVPENEATEKLGNIVKAALEAPTVITARENFKAIEDRIDTVINSLNELVEEYPA